ncbi:hypothetical protein DY000_02047589 [Brassica cretica]|uniref:Uncharacterized protein n=1 Tax=Brassica cretica TaxID=69181 RepID=A0ABQ7EY37_BRACR|nr:hypothetical protein DY000_02047589 [Brassica cretica]
MKDTRIVQGRQEQRRACRGKILQEIAHTATGTEEYNPINLVKASFCKRLFNQKEPLEATYDWCLLSEVTLVAIEITDSLMLRKKVRLQQSLTQVQRRGLKDHTIQVVTSKRLHRPEKIIKLRSLSSASKAGARQGKARRLRSTASPPYHSHPLPTKKLHSRPHSPTKKRPDCISTKKEEDESKLHSY